MKLTPPDLTLERMLWAQNLERVAGVDEVGLGCLAGPIVAAAIMMPTTVIPLSGVRDSKALSAKMRDRLFVEIHQQAIGIGIGMASVAEIETINVLQASYLAMQRALLRLNGHDHALIDGRPINHPNLGPMTTLIKGDQVCYSIACASIVAKVRRDRLMQKLAKRYPGYGWECNKGYGTAQHCQGLHDQGITPWHRKTYGPVRMLLGD